MSIDWRGLAEQALPVLGVAVLACGLTLGALKLSGNLPAKATGGHLTGDQVVVFDVIKYTNAQRAVASKLLGNGAEADRLETGALLLELSKRTRRTIEKIAGPDRVVLVKQAVLQGSAPDITDAVLLELGLPTDVATVAPSDVIGSAAPTWLSLSLRRSANGQRPPAPGTGGSNSDVLP